MRVTKEFEPYNRRRYSAPWIARVVSWDIGKHTRMEFGKCVGDLLTEIEANPGDVIRWGQRDNRGNHTASKWGIVLEDGSLRDATPTEARDHWIAVTATRARDTDQGKPFERALKELIAAHPNIDTAILIEVLNGAVRWLTDINKEAEDYAANGRQRAMTNGADMERKYAENEQSDAL